jgi:hypothetical protein
MITYYPFPFCLSQVKKLFCTIIYTVLFIQLLLIITMKSYRLTSKDRAYISRLVAVQSKTLGEILREADLVSPWQIKSALQEKTQHPDLRIGEILAQKNLIKPETANFFAQDWTKAVIEAEKHTLGYYLKQAAILDREQIEVILAEQRASGVRFGTVAVLQGFIKSTTLDFFLANLFPEESNVSPFMNLHRGSTLF